MGVIFKNDVPYGDNGSTILNTMEEIEANTEENKIAGALAVKEVIEEVNKTTFNGAKALLATNVAASTTQQVVTIPDYSTYNMLAIVLCTDTAHGGSTIIIPRAMFGYSFPFYLDTSSANSSYNIKAHGHINNGNIVLQKVALMGWTSLTIKAYGIK